MGILYRLAQKSRLTELWTAPTNLSELLDRIKKLEQHGIYPKKFSITPMESNGGTIWKSAPNRTDPVSRFKIWYEALFPNGKSYLVEEEHTHICDGRLMRGCLPLNPEPENDPEYTGRLQLHYYSKEMVDKLRKEGYKVVFKNDTVSSSKQT